MTETRGQEPVLEWTRRWRVARTTVIAAAGWILALPVLARLMRWHRRTATWVQNILGPISGLVWGRIGWVGVRRYDFSTEDAFMAGGLAGAVAPTVELTMRRLGWPPGSQAETELQAEPPPLVAYPFAWFWGFLFGGLLAALGAVVARIGRD
ncbi:MAG: hypothetical protein PVI80_11715 [Anaerolineae bacterium]